MQLSPGDYVSWHSANELYRTHRNKASVESSGGFLSQLTPLLNVLMRLFKFSHDPPHADQSILADSFA